MKKIYPYQGMIIAVNTLAVGALVSLLYGKYRLGIVRYFDADEFAYFHWAHNVYAGRLPYRDFLSYIPPGFVSFLAPLYLWAEGTGIFVAGRIAAWMVFTLLCLVLGLILRQVWQMKTENGNVSFRLWQFLLPGIILSSLAVPADKLLEVRPDTLAILLAMTGTWLQLVWVSHKDRAAWPAFASGLLYMASLLVLPKTLPSVAVGVVAAFAVSVRLRPLRMERGLWWFAGGFAAPVVIFAVWWILIGGLGELRGLPFWYQLGRLPFEVNAISRQFGMQPDLFFYPNGIYYGTYGWSRELITNHVLWIAGLGVCVYRFVTPFFISGKARIAYCILSTTCLIYVWVFMYGVGLRHAQYLIPVAVFAALFAADAVIARWNAVRTTAGALAAGAGIIVMLLFLASVNAAMFEVKQRNTNEKSVRTLEAVLAEIPPGAYVFDLDGATVYFRDPYYVSAVPFGQWMPYMSRRLPDVVAALETTGTQYVYEGLLKRTETLPPQAREYVVQRFLPHPTIEGLLVRKK